MSRTHKDNNGEPLCRKVPNWASMSTNWDDVDCRYCLKLKDANCTLNESEDKDGK